MTLLPHDSSQLLPTAVKNVTAYPEPFPIRAWQLSGYLFIVLTGLIGNSLVLSVVRNNKAMKSSSFGTYLGALAVADIIVSILCLPVYLTSTSWFVWHPLGTAGDIMCKVLSGYNILFFFATVSVYTLVAISLERYVAVCKPLLARRQSTVKRAKLIIVGIWICSALLGILSIVGEESASSDKASVGAHCRFSNAYENDIIPKVIYVCVFSIQCIFPVTCMVLCFIWINKELQGQVKVALSKENLQPAEIAAVKKRKKTINTVIIVVVSYFSCWSMNQVLYFCLNFGLISVNWNSNLMQVSVVLCFFSSCINPVIYAFRSQEFRKGFAEIIKNARCCHFEKEPGYSQLRAPLIDPTDRSH